MSTHWISTFGLQVASARVFLKLGEEATAYDLLMVLNSTWQPCIWYDLCWFFYTNSLCVQVSIDGFVSRLQLILWRILLDNCDIALPHYGYDCYMTSWSEGDVVNHVGMDLGGVHGEQTVLKDDPSHWGALYEYSLLALGHGTQFTSSFDFKVLVSMSGH
jgi:hypothetical protein